MKTSIFFVLLAVAIHFLLIAALVQPTLGMEW
jgi:hypothetical protein